MLRNVCKDCYNYETYTLPYSFQIQAYEKTKTKKKKKKKKKRIHVFFLCYYFLLISVYLNFIFIPRGTYPFLCPGPSLVLGVS